MFPEGRCESIVVALTRSSRNLMTCLFIYLFIHVGAFMYVPRPSLKKSSHTLHIQGRSLKPSPPHVLPYCRYPRQTPSSSPPSLATLTRRSRVPDVCPTHSMRRAWSGCFITVIRVNHWYIAGGYLQSFRLPFVGW